MNLPKNFEWRRAIFAALFPERDWASVKPDELFAYALVDVTALRDKR